MNNNDLLGLKQRVEVLVSELQKIGPVMRGSVTEIGKKNNKQAHFSVSIQGRTKLIYLGEKREGKAKRIFTELQTPDGDYPRDDFTKYGDFEVRRSGG